MTVDADTGEGLSEETDEPEELSESEMRAFDGDILEPQSLKESNSTTTDSTTTDEPSPSITPSSFDKDTAIYLLKLLDGIMDIA